MGDCKSVFVCYGFVVIVLMNVGVELIKMYFGMSVCGVEGWYGCVCVEVVLVNYCMLLFEWMMLCVDVLVFEVEETRVETAAATALAFEVEEMMMLVNVWWWERECGLFVVDGYVYVNLMCLVMSVMAREFVYASASGREKLRAYIEEYVLYDGVVVCWGIYYMMEIVEECGEWCKEYVVKLDGIGVEVLSCNVFVWCFKDVGEGGCFELDVY